MSLVSVDPVTPLVLLATLHHRTTAAPAEIATHLYLHAQTTAFLERVIHHRKHADLSALRPGALEWADKVIRDTKTVLEKIGVVMGRYERVAAGAGTKDGKEGKGGKAGRRGVGERVGWVVKWKGVAEDLGKRLDICWISLQSVCVELLAGGCRCVREECHRSMAQDVEVPSSGRVPTIGWGDNGPEHPRLSVVESATNSPLDATIANPFSRQSTGLGYQSTAPCSVSGMHDRPQRSQEARRRTPRRSVSLPTRESAEGRRNATVLEEEDTATENEGLLPRGAVPVVQGLRSVVDWLRENERRKQEDREEDCESDGDYESVPACYLRPLSVQSTW